MTSTAFNQFVVLFLTLCILVCNCDAWIYLDKYKNKEIGQDVFGTRNFEVTQVSSSEVQLRLTARPYIEIIAGEGKRIPYINIKIFETKSGKMVYKSKESLCKYVKSCPLPSKEVAKIDVSGKSIKQCVAEKTELMILII
jgi:hypothetical protein